MSVEVTGAAYVEAMKRDPTDREYRRAFQDFALELAPPHGTLFDFGSGPGIDARHYAAAGLRVGAYDVNVDMCNYFERECAAEIIAGTVQLHTGSYAEFLRRALPRGGGVDLIVANFAPLNLVAELPPLFAKFAAMLKPDGQLLLSVLNPFFHGLWSSRRWWSRLPRLLVLGTQTTPLHGVIPVTRWLPGRLAREARPHFTLAGVYAPSTTRRPAIRVDARSPSDWPRICATQFLFLHLRQP